MSFRTKFLLGAAGLALLLLGAAGLTPADSRPAGPAPAVELSLGVNDSFTFTKPVLTCAAGSRVRLSVKHHLPASGPDIPHTVALLTREADVAVFARAVLEAKPEDHYVPASFRTAVLSASPLIHPGQTVELVFDAPATPGDYPLVCSFPGHCLLGMRATLQVR